MKPRLTIIAAALLAATSILAASEANALIMMNGWSLNGIALNGTTTSAVTSQGFDFNNVAVVSWTRDGTPPPR